MKAIAHPGALLALAVGSIWFSEAWLVGCPPLAACEATRHSLHWVSMLPAGGALALTIGIAAALVCAGILAMRFEWRLRRLPLAVPPPRLVAAARRTGAVGIRAVEDAAVTAFCAGIVNPRIYVTAGLVKSLRDAELDAVLWHEVDHRQHREPLRRLLAASLARVFFFVPALAWWARHRVELAELQADRFAVARCGRKAVAGALFVVGSVGQGSAAGFDDAAEARIAELLGGARVRARIGTGLLIRSICGAMAAVTLAACIVHDFTHLY